LRVFRELNEKYQILLEKIYELTELPENEEIQRKKFNLLSKLISDLCDHRKFKNEVKEISSFLIILLNLYKKRYPLDIHSSELNTTRNNELLSKKLIHVLRKEFSVE
jgi:hypothetical protein